MLYKAGRILTKSNGRNLYVQYTVNSISELCGMGLEGLNNPPPSPMVTKFLPMSSHFLRLMMPYLSKFSKLYSLIMTNKLCFLSGKIIRFSGYQYNYPFQLKNRTQMMH